MLRKHSDEREDTVGPLWEDDAHRATGHAAVEEGEVVDVRDNARLKRPHLVHRDRVMRADGVVDIKRDLLVRLAAAFVHLDHDRTFCRTWAEVSAKLCRGRPVDADHRRW